MAATCEQKMTHGLPVFSFYLFLYSTKLLMLFFLFYTLLIIKCTHIGMEGPCMYETVPTLHEGVEYD
jgi:hypothetical protein